MHYYDLKRNWKQIQPHLDDQVLNALLVRDFNKFTYGRWRQPFKKGMYPRDFETCDWDLGHRGKEPRFWRYVKHAACHWLVNFSLHLAMLTVPKKSLRLITSDQHSTVWDGEDLLFDFNYQAMGVPAQDCFDLAFNTGQALQPGALLKVGYASHYRTDDRASGAKRRRGRKKVAHALGRRARSKKAQGKTD